MMLECSEVLSYFCIHITGIGIICIQYLTSFPERDVVPWLERSLMVRWVVGSILHGVGPIELFLVPASASTTGITKAVVCIILSV